MVPSHVNPAIMQLSSHCSFRSLISVLITPFPIEASNDARSNHHMFEDMRPHEPALSSQLLFGFFGSFAKLVTDSGDGSV